MAGADGKFDLILLDLMMPRMGRRHACREIRKLCDTPVLMLTARSEEYDRIAGFEAGADDYVVKPFSPKELMLRMAAILKRNNRTEAEEPAPLRFGGVTLSPSGRWLEVDGRRVPLTGREFELLCYLAARPGLAVTRQSILLRRLGGDTDAPTAPGPHIKCLRKALGPYNGYISTLRGVGYRFEEA